MTESLLGQLIDTIGEKLTVKLLDQRAGTRLYIGHRRTDDDVLTAIIGEEAAAALAKRFAPSTLRIPLGRELRARHYLADGVTNGLIAVRLGLTETAVDKIVKRLREADKLALLGLAKEH